MFEDSLQYSSIIDSKQESQRLPSTIPPPNLNNDHQEFITKEQDICRAQLEQLQKDLLQALQRIQDLEGINAQQKVQEQNKLYQMQQHYQLEMKRIQAESRSQVEAEYYQQIEDLNQKLKQKKKQFKSKEQFLMTTADDYRKSLQGNELQSKQMIADKAKIIADEQCKEQCEIILKLEEENKKLKTQSEDLKGENEGLKAQIFDTNGQVDENKKLIVKLEEEKQNFKSQNEVLKSDNEKLKQQVLLLSETVKQQEKKDKIPTKNKQNSNHINDQKLQQFMIQTNVYINKQRGTGSKDQCQGLVQNQFYTQPNFPQAITSNKSQSQQKQQGNNQRQQLIKQVSPTQNNRYKMDVQGTRVKPPKPNTNSLTINQSQIFEIGRNIQTSSSSRNLLSASPGNKFIK